MMKDFTAVDAAIVKAIQDGNQRFGDLFTDAVFKATTPLIARVADRDRLVDRRLQALRKRGVITYHGKRWWNGRA